MLDQNEMPATLAHLPGIYQVDATDPGEHEGPLTVLLRVYELVNSAIGATIDDGATYLDPLTTPSLSAERHSGVPQPAGVATLKALVTRAKTILKSENYPADQKHRLEELIKQSGLRLAALAESRATADKLLARSWTVVSDIAASYDPLIAAAATMARRAGLPPEAALETMRAVLKKVKTLQRDTNGQRSVLIARAEVLLARIDAELETLEHSWNLMPELQFYIPPSDVVADADFLAWLGTWVGVDVTEVETAERGVSLERRRRELVKEAAVLWRHRGTPRGLEAILDAFYDVHVDINEWMWPQGMRIEQSSTIGIDTALLPDANLNHSFVAVWKRSTASGTPATGTEWRLPIRRQDGKSSRGWLRVENLAESQELSADAFRVKAQKIRRAIDRERPAHTNCFLAFGLEETKEPAKPMEMQIGVHSRVGACVLPDVLPAPER